MYIGANLLFASIHRLLGSESVTDNKHLSLFHVTCIKFSLHFDKFTGKSGGRGMTFLKNKLKKLKGKVIPLQARCGPESG